MLAFACAFTMFAGAAFTDQADINADNVDAVDLLTTLKIIKGYEDGSFDPEGTVDRAEMAKMIYTIRNGGNDDASAHVGNTTSFTDISGHWAEGYIKYLQNTGIVAGKSATQFAPDAQVTTAEAMKMALALAGYDEKNAGLTGIDWQKNTLTYATTIGLTDNVASAMNAGCTRQDAAQILANALGATAVRYSAVVENFVNDSKSGLSFGGDPISVGRKWMDLWTSIGTLTSIEGQELTLTPSTSDVTDSDKDDNGNMIRHFIRVGTDYSELLGQKVKVLFSDGKNNSVIGVYAVPDNNIVIVNQNQIDVDAGKIVIDDTGYTLENDGVEVIIDGQPEATDWKAGDFKDEQSANVVTLIDTDDNNKIDVAYIKTVDVVKVTYVSSSQIIAGSKTYKFADENIAEDVAKDDWVIITNNTYNENKDIEIAEMATGTVEATRDGSFMKYQIGDTWYNEAKDDSDKDINTNVKPGVDAEYVAVNGILFYAAKTTAGADKLEDVLFVGYVGQDGLTDDQARVMFPNGDKATINLKNNYVVEQNGDPIDATRGNIAEGFYEYNKSGDTYELVELSYDEDFYGDYTAQQAADLNVNGTIDYGTVAGKSIADSADVIVWTVNRDSRKDDSFEFKHITGKQLKALMEADSTGHRDVTVGADDNIMNQFDEDLIGAFTSDVNGLNRASVLAVEYKTDDGELPGDIFDDISSNANYGFITSDGDQIANSRVRFTVWTGTENVDVVADDTHEEDYKKGTIIGYTDIVDEDGTNVMTDANPILGNDVQAGSITDANSDGSTIDSNITGEKDLDNWSTVLYVDSKNGTGITEPLTDVTAPSQKIINDTYYATNILVFDTEVIVIDVNEIAGHVYNAVDLSDVTDALEDRFSSVQWLNDRTNDTDKTGAYDGAMMRLSFYAGSDGEFTILGLRAADNNDGNSVSTWNATAGDWQTTFTYTADEHNIYESLIVTGVTDPLEVTFPAADDEEEVTGNGDVTAYASGTATFGNSGTFTISVVALDTDHQVGMATMNVYASETADADDDVNNLFDSSSDFQKMFNQTGTIANTMNLKTTAATPAGTYWVAVTFDNVTSERVKIEVAKDELNSQINFGNDVHKAGNVNGTIAAIESKTFSGIEDINAEVDTATGEVTVTIYADANHVFVTGASGTGFGFDSGTNVSEIIQNGAALQITGTYADLVTA